MYDEYENVIYWYMYMCYFLIGYLWVLDVNT